MSKLTNGEFKVLQAIDRSEYGESIVDPVWSFTIADNSDLPSKSIPGHVASLSKKGLVRCSGGGTQDDGATIEITEAGAVAYINAVGKENVRKFCGE